MCVWPFFSSICSSHATRHIYIFLHHPHLGCSSCCFPFNYTSENTVLQISVVIKTVIIITAASERFFKYRTHWLSSLIISSLVRRGMPLSLRKVMQFFLLSFPFVFSFIQMFYKKPLTPNTVFMCMYMNLTKSRNFWNTKSIWKI